MLNPNLDSDELAARFRIDDRVRIENLFDPEIVARMRECCLRAVPFEYMCHVDNKYAAIPPQEMAALTDQRKQELQQKMFAAAAQGMGFFYCGYMMTRAQKDAPSEDLQFLHSVFEYLNGPDMLSFICKVTGRSDLKSADAQYTRYTPGQFLTRHRDDMADKQRRLAYVLSMSQNWHPDWGGLLQFFEDNGTPRDAWAPAFNTLALFDIRHVHSVTFVAPFAQEPRLSVTGWFRSKA